MCKKILLIVGALICLSRVEAQDFKIEPRIEGLGANQEYMELLKHDFQLQTSGDSLVKAVEQQRALLGSQGVDPKQQGQVILQIEGEIFNLRNQRAALTNKINQIEQDWIMTQLDSQHANTSVDSLVVESPDSLGVTATAVADGGAPILTDNGYFTDKLIEDEVVALNKANHLESRLHELSQVFLKNYHIADSLSMAYSAAPTEEEAAELMDRYNSFVKTNKILSDSISAGWSYVFDNKSYVYSYVLDLARRDDMLDAQTIALNDVRQQLSEIEGKSTSDEVSNYFATKDYMLDCELSIAKWLNLQNALDSLEIAKRQHVATDYLFPKLEIEQRSFVKYEPIEFSSPSKYRSFKDIPECRVYDYGTIYRILLANFSSPRYISIFRGVSPLYGLEDVEDESTAYYAGGFATMEEAVEAQKTLKAKGFNNPRVAKWENGEYTQYTAEQIEQFVAPKNFRLEIKGQSSLDGSVREAVLAIDGGVEFSRVGGDVFVVAPFTDREVVDSVVEAIKALDSTLQLQVVPIIN